MMSGDAILTIDVVGLGRPITANGERKMPRTTAAKHRKRWRNAAAEAWAAAAVRPITGPVVVHCQPHYRTRASWPDATAVAPTQKAIVDGLREPTAAEARVGSMGAGLIPDDGTEYVSGSMFWPPVLEDADGLRVWLVPADASGSGSGSGSGVEPVAIDVADAAPDALDDWQHLRDLATSSAYRAMAWLEGSATGAPAAMSDTARMTGIKRTSLIRWISGDAYSPADSLMRALDPVGWAASIEPGQSGRRRGGVLRNGGPFPVLDDGPTLDGHRGFSAVVAGRWRWMCSCGETGHGLRVGEPLAEPEAEDEYLRSEAAAVAGWHHHIELAIEDWRASDEYDF